MHPEMKSCFFFLLTLLDGSYMFLGNKRNKRLIVGRSWERHKKGWRRHLQHFFPFHGIVTESRLDCGWVFFSTSVDMCFPSDRTAWHLTLARSHELRHVQPINRKEKTCSCTQTLLPLTYLWSLGWLGLHICQKQFTPVCFGFFQLCIITSRKLLWARWFSMAWWQCLFSFKPSWIMKWNFSKLPGFAFFYFNFIFKDWRRKRYTIFCKTRSPKRD